MQQYTRIFMPLIDETKGYEYKNKVPVGRCLLESRGGEGKLMVWVQNLKPEALYRVNLIFKEGNVYAGLPLCSLSVRSEGKAELRHNFNAADIEGFGRSLDQCLGVAIIVVGDSNTAAPLCGYRSGILPWRSGFKKVEPPVQKEREEKAKIEIAEEVLEEVSEEEDKDTAGEKIINDEEKEVAYAEIADKGIADEEDEGAVEDEIKGDKEEFQEAAEESQEAAEESQETVESQEVVEEQAEEQKIDTPMVSAPENVLSDVFKEEVEAVFKTHTHMNPFEKQNRQVKWVRISLSENLSLPSDICGLLSGPFVEDAYKKYSHIILGKADDDGPMRYYIGIPSLYDPKDKIEGFKQFKCSEDKKPQPSDYGYWLIFMS